MRILEKVRPEALADVPGDAEYDLTRAVVLYRARHLYWEQDAPGLSDLGVALVLDGSFPLVAEAVDLGSGRLHNLDLTVQVVVLDWVNERTLAHVRELRASEVAQGNAWSAASPLVAYCENLLGEVVRRSGWSALTRPLLMRVAFRDLVRDVDVNEEPLVRVRLPGGGVASLRLDADDAALVVTTSGDAEDATVRAALDESFVGAELSQRGGAHVVGFALPRSAGDVAVFGERVMDGVLRLYARLEPRRYDAVAELLRAVGRRNSLPRLLGGPEPVHRLAIN